MWQGRSICETRERVSTKLRAMRWQLVIIGWMGLGGLACHSAGDAAPDGKAPVAAVGGASAEGSPVPAAGAGPEAPPSTPSPGVSAASPSAPPAPGTSAADAECEKRRAAIEVALGAAASCSSDADCTSMYPNCPFGCARAIGKSTDVSALQAEIESYKTACNTCMYRCMPPPGAPTCRAGRCAFGDG